MPFWQYCVSLLGIIDSGVCDRSCEVESGVKSVWPWNTDLRCRVLGAVGSKLRKMAPTEYNVKMY